VCVYFIYSIKILFSSSFYFELFHLFSLSSSPSPSCLLVYFCCYYYRGEFSEFFVDSRDNSTTTTTSNTLSTNNNNSNNHTNNTRVSVSEVERICVEGNFFEGESCGTIDVLTYLRKEYPEKEFQLVLGYDSFSDLCNKKWKQGDRILETTHINVFRRGGMLIDPEKYRDYSVTFYDMSAVSSSSSLSSSTSSSSSGGGGDASAAAAAVGALPDVSSTLIREKFKYVYDNNLEDAVLSRLESNDLLGAGKDKVVEASHNIGILFDANYINPLVAAYIIRNRLFSVPL
jgi:nicotinic acid mononucleotide adenylyltransferase